MEEKNMLSQKSPVPLDSGLLYSVIALYYVYVSKFLVKLGLTVELRLLLSQILFLLLPPVLLAVIRGYNIKETFRLKAPRPLEVVIMLVMSPVMIVAGFCAGFTALLVIKIIFGKVYLTGEVSILMSNNILIAVLLVGVLPAFCEEMFFRGMFQKGLEKLGAACSILLSGIMFGLFHFDFQRLAAQTIIGLLSAYVVYRTGSIFNGMILHFMNNTLLTLLSNYMTGGRAADDRTVVITDPFDTPAFTQFADSYGMTLDELLGIMAIGLTVFLFVSAAILAGFVYAIRNMTKDRTEKPVKVRGSAKGLLAGIPGLMLIGITYTALALTLLNNDLGVKILKFMGIM